MSETIHDTRRLDTWDANADALWLVTAIIQPFKLDSVMLALESSVDFGGVTVSDCRGFGREKLDRDRATAREPATVPTHTSGEIVDYHRKVRLECAVSLHTRAIEVARAIAVAAHTGRDGDGKVWIARLSGAIAIRTFGVDQDAL